MPSTLNESLNDLRNSISQIKVLKIPFSFVGFVGPVVLHTFTKDILILNCGLIEGDVYDSAMGSSDPYSDANTFDIGFNGAVQQIAGDIHPNAFTGYQGGSAGFKAAGTEVRVALNQDKGNPATSGSWYVLLAYLELD